MDFQAQLLRWISFSAFLPVSILCALQTYGLLDDRFIDKAADLK